MSTNNQYIFDADTELKDAGAIAASAAAQVGGADQILDMGADGFDSSLLASYYEGDIVIDVTALDFTTADETYQILAQVSNSATFSTGVKNAAAIVLGDAANGASDDTDLGQRVLHVNNMIAGTKFRYLRLFTAVGGTTPSINYTAFLTKSMTQN